jgi:hypothetical protein
MEPGQPAERPRLDREEVSRGDRLPVGPQEGAPRQVPLRGRPEAVLLQDAADRGPAHPMPEVGRGWCDRDARKSTGIGARSVCRVRSMEEGPGPLSVPATTRPALPGEGAKGRHMVVRGGAGLAGW